MPCNYYTEIVTFCKVVFCIFVEFVQIISYIFVQIDKNGTPFGMPLFLSD